MEERFFTIIFQDRQGQGRMARCRLRWVKGKELRRYLREPPLLELSLMGFALRCKMHNSQRRAVRLTYVPTPDDFVVITPVKV